MFSHTKCKIDWTSTTYFLFRVSEDTGYTVRQQQSIKYRKKNFRRSIQNHWRERKSEQEVNDDFGGRILNLEFA